MCMHKTRFLYTYLLCFSFFSGATRFRCYFVIPFFRLSFDRICFSVLFILLLILSLSLFNRSYFLSILYIYKKTTMHIVPDIHAHLRARWREKNECCCFVSEICWKVLNMHKNSHGLNSNNCEIFNVAFFPLPEEEEKKKKVTRALSFPDTNTHILGKFYILVQKISFNKLLKIRMCTMFARNIWIDWLNRLEHCVCGPYTCYQIYNTRCLFFCPLFFSRSYASVSTFELCYFFFYIQLFHGEKWKTSKSLCINWMFVVFFFFNMYSMYVLRYVLVLFSSPSINTNEMHP